MHAKAWLGGRGTAGKSEAFEPAAFQPDSARHTWRGVAWLLATLTLTCFATAVLSPVWNYSATSYFSTSSTYSILDPLLHWGTDTANSANLLVAPVIYIKLYEDVVVYFSVLAALGVLGWAALHVPSLRRELQRRYPVSLPKQLAWLDLFPTGATLGELLIVGAVCGLYAYWLWFWGFSYGRITTETQLMGDAYANWQIGARVLGHLTTLTMSLLTFPVTRNSVWEAAFGIPFDRAVKYHRHLGSLCWVLVTAHMLAWQIKWILEGNFANNIATVSNLIIAPCATQGSFDETGTFVTAQCYTDAASGLTYEYTPGVSPANTTATSCPCFYLDAPATQNVVTASNWHADNFTIVLAELAWLLLTLALSVAVYYRRKNYEAFQYTHHAVLAFFAAGLVHAWSHWYYTAAGLALYAFDKVTRTILSARSVDVLSVTCAAPGITRIVVRARFLGRSAAERGRKFYAGQYCWLNVPCVAAGEWHPFTVSSPPCAATAGALSTAYGSSVGADTLAASGAGGNGGVLISRSNSMGGDGAGLGSGGKLYADAASARRRSAAGFDTDSAGGSDDDDCLMTFHIRDMGEGTWTGRLAALARAAAQASELDTAGAAAASDLRKLAISIDGPYGRSGHFYERDTVVLFAGGIGITPFHAILAELHARATGQGAHGAFPSQLRRVHLVWVAKEHTLIDAFADTWAAVLQDSMDGLFQLHIYYDGGSKGANQARAAAAPTPGRGNRTTSEEAGLALLEAAWAAEGGGDPTPVEAGWASSAAAAEVAKHVVAGRPDAAKLLRQAVEDSRAAHRFREGPDAPFDPHARVTAMVCGPPGLAKGVSDAAMALGCDFHSEIFAF